jgi:hypothetical protein
MLYPVFKKVHLTGGHSCLW